MGLFRRQNIVTRADKISEFTVNTAEYGSAVPEVIGTTRISGNVIYYDDFTAHEHKETTKSGKGGGSKQTNITYTYTVAVILGLCEGEISGIGKVWRGKEIYDYPNEKIELTAFLGTQNQQPWAYVVGKHPEKAMPYAGLAYMAGVVDMGNSASLPQFNFEVKGKLLSTGDGVDVNPADYIRYVLDKVGLSNVPIDGLSDYRSFCAEADLLISSPPDSNPKQAQAIINDICKLTNAYFYWSNDRFRIVPVETRPVGEWTPDTTIRYNLTADDFLPQSNGAMVTYSRKDSSEVYNSFPLEFINRENSYEKETVNYQLSQDILDHGLRQASTTSAHYFYTKERAVKVAEMLAHKAQIERNTYTFKLDWAFCRLEPADIVTITDANIGVNNLTVRITSVNEDAKGAITCTAVEVDNVSGEAQYDVHNVDRPYVDFNAPPDDVEQVLILQPPADITADGLELWIGATGGENWGGCTVWVSDDNINYRSIGQLNNSARMGELQANMTADATSCVVSCNDVLISGTQQDAERGNTLCWIGGECLSYTTATMLQNGNYELSGLVRGQYNTTASAHSAGDQFARLDSTLLKEAFRKEDIGKTIYLKFTSFNIFGAAEQDLSDVDPYQYTIQAYYIPPVTNVTAYNRYRMMKDGVARYDIVVDWTPPNLQSYLEGQVWYKTDHGQITSINAVAGVAVNQLGFQGEWTFGGSGKNQVIIPQAVVGDTYRIAVVTKDEWGAATSVDFAPYTTITVALRSETPNTPDNFSITFGKDSVCSWSEVTNADIQFYEIRKDTYAGIESANMLGRTNGTTYAVTLTQRSGTLYLYAKSPQGKYSSPAVLMYSKEAPQKPNKPTLSANLGSINIVADSIPQGCSGMNIYIDGDGTTMVHVTNNTYTHSVEAGIYDVEVAYTDIFGEGEHSTSARIVIKKTIDAKLLEDEAINIAKVDATIQSALQDAVNSAKDLITVHGDINTVNARIEEVKSYGEGTHNELVETQNSVTRTIARVDKNEANITTVQQDIKGLRSTVESIDVEGDVSDASAYLQSLIEQQSDRITTTVSKLQGNIPDGDTQFTTISQLQQTADGLSSTVAQKANTSTLNSVNSTLTSKINQQADKITTVVTALGDYTDSSQTDFSAIAQLQDNIELKVSKYDATKADDLITQINLAPQGATIKGKVITLDGDVLFVGNTFFQKMITAGMLNVIKANINSLSALSANIGEFTTTVSKKGYMKITGSLIEVYDSNNKLRVRLGIW